MPCPRGDICDECQKPSTMEVFWHAWQGKYCDYHGAMLIVQSRVSENPPILILGGIKFHA